MAPALVQLFAFMACTFALGLFLGWSLWRYGGISRAAMNDLEAKVEFWKKSLDQSRIRSAHTPGMVFVLWSTKSPASDDVFGHHFNWCI